MASIHLRHQAPSLWVDEGQQVQISNARCLWQTPLQPGTCYDSGLLHHVSSRVVVHMAPMAPLLNTEGFHKQGAGALRSRCQTCQTFNIQACVELLQWERDV